MAKPAALKVFLAFLSLGAIGAVVGCAPQPKRVTLQAKLLSHPNPTNYEFEAGIDEVKAAIEKACGDEWQKDLAAKNHGKMWTGGGDADSTRLLSQALQEPRPHLYWKGRADALARGLLLKPGNENDAYIDNSDAPAESQVYFKDGQPVIYYSDFHIHLTPMSDRKTRVEIFPYDPNVGVGVDETWAPHGPRLMRVAVEPTTIEEYQILLRIGDKLGVKDMPPLSTPTPDSPVRQFTKDRQS